MKKEQLKKEFKNKLKSTKGPLQDKAQNHNRSYNILGFAIIIFLGIIIYSNSFDCSFHFDDLRNFADNPNIPELTNFKSWWNYSQTRLVGFDSFIAGKFN